MALLSATYTIPLTASTAIAVGQESWLPLVPTAGVHPAAGLAQPSSQPTVCVPGEPLMMMYRTAKLASSSVYMKDEPPTVYAASELGDTKRAVKHVTPLLGVELLALPQK